MTGEGGRADVGVDALRAARALSDRHAIPWRALEVAAFAPHPRVRAALDPRGKHHRVSSSPAEKAFLVVGIGFLVATIAPIAAFSLLLVELLGSGWGTRVSVPVASMIFVCALPMLGVFVLDWFRSDRGRDRGRERQTEIIGGFGLLGIVLVVVLVVARNDLVVVPWAAGIAVPTLLAVIFWVRLLADARRRGRDRAPDHVSRDAPEPLRPVRLAVEQLTDEQRAAVRRDLDSAIGDLEVRGLIDATTSADARSAELGKLALHMSQRRRSGP